MFFEENKFVKEILIFFLKLIILEYVFLDEDVL